MATVIGGPANPVFVTNDDPNRSVRGGTALPVYVINFADIPSGGGGEPNASTTERGIIEIATTAEAQAGTDTERAVVPSGLPLRVVGTNALKGPNFTQGDPGSSAIDIQTGRASSSHIASGQRAIAIGFQNIASGADSVAIGRGANASGENAIIIGGGSAVIDAVAVGVSANVAYSGGIAIGRSTLIFGMNGITIGKGATVMGENGVAIGQAVNNPTANTVKIGVSNSSFLHLTTFTPAVGAGVASTHTLSVNISGTVYRILLATP